MLADVGNGSAKTGRKLTFLNAMVRQECVAISIKIGGSQVLLVVLRSWPSLRNFLHSTSGSL
jgi:hypothetical protein